MNLPLKKTYGIGVAIETACPYLSISNSATVSSITNTSRIPILVVAAKSDIASPFESARQLSQRLGAELLSIEGSRHTSVGSIAMATSRAIEVLLD
jgi:predicted alpha/beta hydrolase family esterase